MERTKPLSEFTAAELAELPPSELSRLQQREITRKRFERQRDARILAAQTAREREAVASAPPRRGRPPKNAPAPLAPSDSDDLGALKLELTRHGAMTRQDRIALATKWARNPDPQIALPWVRFLEAMETKSESDPTYGVPPPTNRQEQVVRLSTMQIAVGIDTTAEALELSRAHWRLSGHLSTRLPELQRATSDRSDPAREEPATDGGTGSPPAEAAGVIAAPYDR